MNRSFQEAVTTPIEVIYRDFAFNKLQQDIEKQAEQLKENQNSNGLRK